MGSLTVFIYGGLGNQMFQYSYAKFIANKYSLQLNLNLYGFKIDKYYKRIFELNEFNIEYNEISYNGSLRFNICRIIQHYPKSTRTLRKIFGSLIVENTNLFSNNPFQLSLKFEHYFLYGYWQDEKYFKDIRSILIKEFVPKNKLSIQNLKIFEIVRRNEHCVAVHVRRMHLVRTGKIINYENANVNYAVKDDYYIKAFNYISDRIGNPIFYVFSDYPDWAKKIFINFQFNFIFLDNSRGKDYEDLVLMTHFKHHIIANSSFSWWGAWLGENPDQIVIGPKNTFLCPKLPPKWVQL